MSDEVWTRESLTKRILEDTAGMWKHIEAEQAFRRGGRELLASVKGGCVALLQGELLDTRDLLTLAVCMLHAMREITLEGLEKRQS